MPTRKRELSPDEKGRYRPYLGKKIVRVVITRLPGAAPDSLPDTVVYEDRPHRFNLGTDRREAERRLARIRELYEENCRVNGQEVWSDRALEYAERIAKGEYRIEVPPLSPDCPVHDPVAEYGQVIQVDRDRFPSLDLVPADPALHAESVRRTQEMTQGRLRSLEAELKELGALPPKGRLPERLIPGTLHEALDAYIKDDVWTENVVPGGDRLTYYGQLRVEQVGRLKSHHPDVPLTDLTFDACKSMVDYWKGRPATRRTGKPMMRRTVENHIGELWRFFDWLDLTDRYQWVKPKGLERIDRKVPRTEAERRISAITKPVYLVEELAILSRHATPLDRLALYVGLNCAMGAAELGRLEAGEVILGRRHEHAGRLNFVSTDSDSFIRMLRPKTGVFGEWLLWEETAAMVRWGLARARRIGSDRLFVSDRGEPWYSDTSKNPQAKFANVWTRLLERVRKSHPDFPALPFGTLRDTLPDILRHHYSDELASLSLAHGNPFKADSLLECYGNKPFGRLHTALRELRSHFAPVFAAAPDDPTEEGKQYLPVAVRDKLRAMLAENRRVCDIARECGVSRMTVYRERDEIEARTRRASGHRPTV